ncbi:MAG: ATP-dependent DNA ligase [Microbacterium sp.]|uniref:ATP-dependent DNA ligase n=1 Tax=unclassified Microbacterium TaxID=2609290 RepID=UPI000DB8E990|nr:ATP-dependent DNA ligase [Microbacterium sp.]PZU38625.1 MAG: ATP-dependent DNA ligase [Microbacterium sp.]
MLIAEIVEVSEAVGATRSRLAKIDALARLLARLDEGEIVPAVGFLLARPRQGRLGVGWRGLAALGATGDAVHAPTPRLSVGDVDRALEGLATASGTGSSAARASMLSDLAHAATAREWDFITRVILGELRTGALEGVLLDAIARASQTDQPLVRRAAMLSGDLGETARLALSGADLAALTLRVGRPVLPMLATTAPDVAAALALTGEALVEYKLDGARIQVHRDGDTVGVYTRSLADITHRVPEIVEVVRGLPATRVILDGETLSLDEDGGPRPFQDTMARFGSHGDGPGVSAVLRPWFFDVLHIDGRDLLDEPLSVRLHELERIAAPWRMPGLVTHDQIAAAGVSRDALAAGHEGVVIKALDAPYAAGRRGKSWVKVKPVLTFDLVVLGVEWGSGRRAGALSNLHLGARDAAGEFGPPGGFVMVGKTFKGLTDELLRWQTGYFPTIETRRTPSTVFVRPVTVVEVAIDGVQRSVRYPGGVALRFARVKSYRPDKAPTESDTIASLRALLR